MKDKSDFPVENTLQVIADWESDNKDGVTREIFQLIAAWKSLQQGKANERQQQLCVEIGKYLYQCRPQKKSEITDMKYAIIDGLINDDGLTRADAIRRYMKTNGGSEDTLKREYRKFKKEQRFDVAIRECRKRKLFALLKVTR